MLTPNDLKVVLQLVARAAIPVGEVPAIWPTIQRLEAAAKTGLVYLPASQTEQGEIDVPANAGGTA
jgi:hypothetical protein